jgi:thiamine pyrophosphate-dependent acetolactate synthase large subunit-like protein
LTEAIPTATATGARRLVEMLERLGVNLVFGLPGVHNLAIWKILADSDIRLVGVRHEQTAVYAADGYARATGRLGVALVTTGPGAANTLGATGEAMASGSPVLVIATDIPASFRREGIYRGTLHETRDQTAMFKPVTKVARMTARPDRIAAAVLECGLAARAAPSGPVYLGLPTDLLTQRVHARPMAISLPAPREEELPTELIEQTCELLASAERPLIWAGGGALRAEAGPLVGELALKLAAPVVTTFMGRGLIPPEHPCAVPGPVHAKEVGVLWDEADIVVSIGSDFDGMMTQNWLMPAPPKLVSINVDELEANKNYTSSLTLLGDARSVLEQLVPQVKARDGLSEVERRLGAVRTAVKEAVQADEPQAAALLDTMARALPQDAVVLADMCIPGYWLAGYRQVPAPRKLAYPMGWGTLGFAFPASLGAALADAGPTVCVTGDGGFLFACGELATVADAQIPVTIVLVDDGGYGMLRFDQARAGDEPFGVDLVGPDFEALAGSFGISAETVAGFGSELEAALGNSAGAHAPHMIVVKAAALKPPPTTSPRWYRKR